MYKKYEASYKNQEVSELEQQNKHLKSLRDLNAVPVSTDEWKQRQKEHE